MERSLKDCFEPKQHLTEEPMPAPVDSTVAWVGHTVTTSSYRQRMLPVPLLQRSPAWNSSFMKKPESSRPWSPLFFIFLLCVLPLHKDTVVSIKQLLLPAVTYLQNTSLVWQEFFGLRGGCRRGQLPTYPDGSSWNKSIQVLTQSSTESAFSHVGTNQHLIKSLTEVVKECVFCKLSYENVPRIAINSPKGNFWQIWDKKHSAWEKQDQNWKAVKMAELWGRKNNRLGLVHRAKFTLKASEPQLSGRVDGFQGQMAETENQFTVSERQAKASLQLLKNQKWWSV